MPICCVKVLLFNNMLVSSPREWGCFCNTMIQGGGCLPHASGGVSLSIRKKVEPFLSSPREWGCFSHTLHLRHKIKVFPTRVGVFLIRSLLNRVSLSLPHASGGVSYSFSFCRTHQKSSPREWGCFDRGLAGFQLL